MALNLPPLEDDNNNVEKVKPSYMYDSETINKMLNNGERVFGQPGASLTWGIGGHKNLSTASGETGEKETGEVLNTYVNKTPNAYVIHSTKTHLTQGDIDHVLIQDDTIVFIDAKRWKGSRKYSIGPKYNILRGRTAFPEGYIDVRDFKTKMSEKFPNYKIRSVICIAQDKVFVTKNQNWYKSPYKLIELEKLEEFLTVNLEKNTRQTDLNIVKHFASMCVSANNVIDRVIKNPNSMF